MLLYHNISDEYELRSSKQIYSLMNNGVRKLLDIQLSPGIRKPTASKAPVSSCPSLVELLTCLNAILNRECTVGFKLNEAEDEAV